MSHMVTQGLVLKGCHDVLVKQRAVLIAKLPFGCKELPFRGVTF